MTSATSVFHLFAQGTPGLESVLACELEALGFADVVAVAGGVCFGGSALDVLRANQQLRTAGRVLLRLGTFRAAHLSEIARAAAKLAWEQFIDPAVPVRLRCSCRASRVYHSGAAQQRLVAGIERRLRCSLTLAPPRSEDADLAELARDDLVQQIFMRIERNVCTVSIDTSGAPLHRRNTKAQTGKAPLRDTLAAAFLDVCGWRPGMPLVDPMCGSGTLLLEAASQTAGLDAGRSRTFTCQRWPQLQGQCSLPAGRPSARAEPQLWGYDRDAGAIAMARANAVRAQVTALIGLNQQPLSRLRPPATSKAGLVICNPPYGHRLGDAQALRDLYAALGHIMVSHMAGWRLALITSDPSLARATGLRLEALTPPVPHGGLKIRLYAAAGGATPI